MFPSDDPYRQWTWVRIFNVGRVYKAGGGGRGYMYIFEIRLRTDCGTLHEYERVLKTAELVETTLDVKGNVNKIKVLLMPFHKSLGEPNLVSSP